jgi:hypothetical protein
MELLSRAPAAHDLVFTPAPDWNRIEVMDLEAEFTAAGVQFRDGQPALSGMPGDGSVSASAIRDADPAATPPEIRTVSGVTLFVSAVQRERLQRFCRDHQIPIRRRYDVWADLLEPFLDTDTTDRAAALGRLAHAGLTAAEVTQIRDRVGPLMRAYNALHWEWIHLGLCDLLDAATSPSPPPHIRFADLGRLRADPAESADFRTWAMRIADLGHPT